MFIVADLVSLKERICSQRERILPCSQRERILPFKSSSSMYKEALLPHKGSSLKCYYFLLRTFVYFVMGATS